MKRKIFITFVSALLLLMTFTSCSKIEHGEEKDPEKPAENAVVSTAGKTARIDFQIEDNNGHNDVKIPKFSSDENSEAIDQLNSELESIVEFYKDADNNKLKWPLIYTEVYETDRYLQAIVEYQAYPDIEGPSVASFVYDKSKDAVVTVDDAYTLESTSESQIKKGVEKARCASDESIANLKVLGVYIDKSGNCQFFVKYEFDTGFDISYELATYIPSNGTFLGQASDVSSGFSVRVDE